MSRSIKEQLSLDDNDGLFYIQTSPMSLSSEEICEEKEKKTDVLMETFKTNGRYFEDPNPLIRCYNCNEHGHMSSTCPNPSYKFRCTYCGEQGHTAYSCQLVICHRCQGVGHKISQCNSDTRNKCDACGGSGHSYRSCIARDDPISAKYLSEITCLFCRRKGHINCFSLKSYSKSLFCSRCGEKGHTFSDHRRS